MVALHEALAVVVAQVGAFAAEGLGEQEAGRAGQGQGGGMELVELHVGEFRIRTSGEGDAVAGGYGGVGGVRVDLACAAGGDEDGARGDSAWLRIGSGSGPRGPDRRQRRGRRW